MMDYNDFKEKYMELMNKSYRDLIQTSEVELIKMYVAIGTMLSSYSEDYVMKLVRIATGLDKE